MDNQESSNTDRERKELSELLGFLSEAEQAFIKALNDKHTPDKVFNSETLEEYAKKILRGFNGKTNSIFQDADGHWRVPSANLGEIVLAGGRYLGAGAENRDQVANTLVEDYLKNKKNKVNDEKLYNAMLNCRNGLGSIAMLKGFADRLTKLLYVDAQNMDVSDLAGSLESIRGSIEVTLKDLREANLTLEGNKRAIAEKSLQNFDTLLQKGILTSLDSKIKKLRAIEMTPDTVSPVAPPPTTKHRNYLSGLKSVLAKATSSKAKAPSHTEKKVNKPSNLSQSILEIEKHQLPPLIKILKEQKEQLVSIFDEEKNNTVIATLKTAIDNLSNKKLSPSDYGTVIYQFLNSLNSNANKKNISSSDKTALDLLQGVVKDHIKDNIDTDFTYTPPESVKRPNLK